MAFGFAAMLFGTAAQAQQRPDLTVAVNSLGNKMDPADTPLAVELRIYGSVFDNLIRRDYAAEAADPSKGAVFVPALATDWKRIDDRTVDLNLRQGVKFHNGDDLTAEDVAFTFSQERIFGKDAMLPGAKSFFGCWKPVEVLSTYKVRIAACDADPIIEAKLAHYSAGIVNKRAYLAMGQDAFKRAPVGTGPLSFVEWKTGDYIKFTAFDEFWGGKPNFSSITFREVAEVSARVAGLVSGDFDIITQVSPDQFDVIKQRDDLKVLPALLDQFQGLSLVGNDPAISDKRVRQALAKSIDRDAIVKFLWNGQTTVESQFQATLLGPLYDKDRAYLNYDPAAAKQLLTEAGYSGQPVVLRVPANYYVNGESVMQAVQSMWQAVGINAKVEIVENFAQAYGPGSAAVMGGIGFDLPAPESLGSYFYGEKALIRQRGFPDGVPGMDAAAEKLATIDVAKRKAAFSSMIDIFNDQVPMILLYRTPQFFAAKSNVQWTPTPDFRTDFRPYSLMITGNK
ncbi:ABC transporter substrate-binding protein [Rhizobium sp.]